LFILRYFYATTSLSKWCTACIYSVKSVLTVTCHYWSSVLCGQSVSRPLLHILYRNNLF
jgi:hypothetical protein